MISNIYVSDLVSLLDRGEPIVPGCIVQLRTNLGDDDVVEGRGLVLAVLGAYPPPRMMATVWLYEQPNFVFVPAIPLSISPTITLDKIKKRRFMLI